jgi:hypothetical protein
LKRTKKKNTPLNKNRIKIFIFDTLFLFCKVHKRLIRKTKTY